jgi:hypothetical protein
MIKMVLEAVPLADQMLHCYVTCSYTVNCPSSVHSVMSHESNCIVASIAVLVCHTEDLICKSTLWNISCIDCNCLVMTNSVLDWLLK